MEVDEHVCDLRSSPGGTPGVHVNVLLEGAILTRVRERAKDWTWWTSCLCLALRSIPAYFQMVVD